MIDSCTQDVYECVTYITKITAIYSCIHTHTHYEYNVVDYEVLRSDATPWEVSGRVLGRLSPII